MIPRCLAEERKRGIQNMSSYDRLLALDSLNYPRNGSCRSSSPLSPYAEIMEDFTWQLRSQGKEQGSVSFAKHKAKELMALRDVGRNPE